MAKAKDERSVRELIEKNNQLTAQLAGLSAVVAALAVRGAPDPGRLTAICNTMPLDRDLDRVEATSYALSVCKLIGGAAYA